jgi:hypothetical protein
VRFAIARRGRALIGDEMGAMRALHAPLTQDVNPKPDPNQRASDSRGAICSLHSGRDHVAAGVGKTVQAIAFASCYQVTSAQNCLQAAVTEQCYEAVP